MSIPSERKTEQKQTNETKQKQMTFSQMVFLILTEISESKKSVINKKKMSF